MQAIDDNAIDRLANEPWYVSTRASQKDRFARCLKLIQTQDFSPRNAYDIGCANGQFSALLADLGAKVTGFDINSGRIKDNQLNYGSSAGLDFRCEDFLTGEVDENAVDLITALEVLYYFSHEQQQLFFQKAYETLQPQGRLLVSVNVFFTGHFSEESFLELIDERFNRVAVDRIYRNCYYRFELPLIEWLDQIKYLEKLRLFSPNILRLNRKFYPGVWNWILLRPSRFMDRYLLTGIRTILLGLLESRLIYWGVTELTRIFSPTKGQSQMIILLKKPA